MIFERGQGNFTEGAYLPLLLALEIFRE